MGNYAIIWDLFRGSLGFYPITSDQTPIDVDSTFAKRIAHVPMSSPGGIYSNSQGISKLLEQKKKGTKLERFVNYSSEGVELN